MLNPGHNRGPTAWHWAGGECAAEAEPAAQPPSAGEQTSHS